MPSGGALTVGFKLINPQLPRVQFIGNPDQEDTLILENRYAGPLAIQWADSDIQIGAGLIGQAMAPNFNIPPLSRCTIPWPRKFGANISVMTLQVGNVLFNNAQAAGNPIHFRASDLRYWFIDAGATLFHVVPLYPESQRIVVARQNSAMVQGTQIADVVIGGGVIATVAGFTANSLLTGIGGTSANFNDTPSNQLPEGRIMRVAAVFKGGTALLQDLECTPFYDADGDGNSFYPMGSSAVATAEHQMSQWVDCPGAVGCMWDINGAAAAATITFSRLYEIAVPFD